MSNPRDYYEVLGVSRSANASEIKAAHRRLARKLHPDVNKGEKAGEQFAELQRSYEVLSDPEKRKLYDQFGHAGVDPSVGGPQSGWPGGGGGGAPRGTYTWSNVAGRPRPGGAPGQGGGFDEVDMGSIFEEMFGGGRGGGGFGQQARARPKRPSRGQDVARDIEVGFEEAIAGSTRSLKLSRGGSSQTIDVKIPTGTSDGTKLRVRGAGSPGQAGAGDLILTVRVAKHPVFEREGHDLVVDVPVTIVEATLGAKVKIPTLGGSATVTIPPGTSSGQRLRLKGQGVSKGKSAKGDLYARVKIVAPKGLSGADQDALKKIGKKLDSPRTGKEWE